MTTGQYALPAMRFIAPLTSANPQRFAGSLPLKIRNLWTIATIMMCTLTSAINLSAQCTSASEYGHLTFFNDGSGGSSNYENNQSCSWSFESGIGGIVRVGFYEFHTEANYDFVRIYDGTDASAPLIAELSGDIDTEQYLTTGSFVYIEWSSDGSNTAPGFEGFIDSYNASRTDCSGFISDGNNDYPNDIIFRWTIAPPDAEMITLDFSSIDMESCCDEVRIYDGMDNSAPLIGTYTGDTPQSDIVAMSGTMYIEMETDGSVTGAGFTANYNCSFCAGTTVLTSNAGTITDGSTQSDHANRTDCAWLIDLSDANPIEIEFTELDLESCCDFVRIYDGTSDADPLLGSYTGSTLPGTITTSGGAAYVTFTTDGSVVNDGWSLNYSGGDPLSVAGLEQRFNIEAFPNPTSGLVTLNLAYEGSASLSLELFDLQGRQLDLAQDRIFVSNTAQHVLDLTPYEAGYYMLRVADSEGHASHLKIAKVH